MEGVERLPLFSCRYLIEGITPNSIIILPSGNKDYNEGITPCLDNHKNQLVSIFN